MNNAHTVGLGGNLSVTATKPLAGAGAGFEPATSSCLPGTQPSQAHCGLVAVVLILSLYCDLGNLH